MAVNNGLSQESCPVIAQNVSSKRKAFVQKLKGNDYLIDLLFENSKHVSFVLLAISETDLNPTVCSLPYENFSSD